MKKFYIQDSTINQFVYFDTVSELVTWLEGICKRAYNLTRQQYTQNLAELGYGYDDASGVTFTRAMSEQFNIGIVTAEGKHFKADVHTAVNFTQEEYGDRANNRFDDRSRRYS